MHVQCMDPLALALAEEEVGGEGGGGGGGSKENILILFITCQLNTHLTLAEKGRRL